MEKYISVARCAKMIDVSQETVRRFLRDGRLNGVKLGDSEQARWRIPIREVERYMESCIVTPFIPQYGTRNQYAAVR